MGLFSNRRPIINKNDVSDPQKVKDFVQWFLKHEKLVTTLLEPSNNIIFNEGYRPFYEEGSNPEEITKMITSLEGWFITKMFTDLNLLQNAPKEDWRNFIDKLDKLGEKTLITSGELAIKYGLNTKQFIYTKEIVKIPPGKDLEIFKTNYLRDNVLGAEIRILAWLYLNYFNESYKIDD